MCSGEIVHCVVLLIMGAVAEMPHVPILPQIMVGMQSDRGKCEAEGGFVDGGWEVSIYCRL